MTVRLLRQLRADDSSDSHGRTRKEERQLDQGRGGHPRRGSHEAGRPPLRPFGRVPTDQSKKTKAWEEISGLLNSRGRSGLRTLSEIKKKYQNIKQKAKAKRSLSVRPPTGGGPKPDSPSVPEQLVLDNLEGRPSLCGVVGGIDTEDTMSISETATIPQDGATTQADLTSNISFNISDITDIDPSMLSDSYLGGETAVPVKVSTEQEILNEELERIKDSR